MAPAPWILQCFPIDCGVAVSCLILYVLLALSEGFECSLIVYDDDNQINEFDDRLWDPSPPLLGSRILQTLMGERGLVRDWERAQFQGNVVDNVAEMEHTRGVVGLARPHNSSPPLWQLPLLLSVLTLICGVALFLVVLKWLKNQMSSTSSSASDKVEAGVEEGEGAQWISHPVITPQTTEQCEILPVVPVQPQVCWSVLPEVMSRGQGAEEKREPVVRIKAKGLLERRGSSASLTIDLLHPSQENLAVTPTREWYRGQFVIAVGSTAEEYLLSAGNVLSRGQLRLCLKDPRALHKEFWDLPLNHPDHLSVPGSGVKNRYRSIIPNENTRVHLPSETLEDPFAGYINANYIKGYDGEDKAFIATQGPLANTISDFWQMVWAEHCPVIVMITKLMEKNRSKCELYFPIDPGATETYAGDILVTVSSIVVKDGYIIRHFIIQKGDEIRRVTHFWFDSWPDHKTPANAHSLLCLAKDVESYRFRDIQRGSTSSWPHSPKPAAKHEPSAEGLLSPCAEVASPPSLKEVSPVLNFGRLEFKDDEAEKEAKGSPKSDDDENILLLTSSEISEEKSSSLPLQATNIAIDPDTSSDRSDSAFKIVPVLADKLNSPTFYDRSLYSNDDVFQVGSLPQRSPVQTRVQLENIRSKSVEAASSCGSSKSEERRDTKSEFFDFDKLTIAQETAADESVSSDNRIKMSETSDVRQDSFEKKIHRGITRTSSPNWTSEASPNLTHSFDKSTSKLSVESLSWGGLDIMSPNLTGSEKSPNRTQSSIESPVTHSSSESRRWPRSSDSSKQWTRSSQGSSGWAQSSEDSPRWLEKDEEPESSMYLRSPRDWFDRSPLSTRRSREGSVSFLWNEVVARGPAAGPVVVHCSAGIGRTGCFVALCIGVSQLLGENNVDILGIVCRMRYDRGGMVQTAEQYEFIHRALAMFERSLPDQSGE